MSVRAVRRAFDLLALLGGENPITTLSELARVSSLPVSTVARLLGTLEHAGFVQREVGGRYVAGIRLMQLGLRALSSVSLYELAEPHLRRLSELSGETANLAVRATPDEAIYLRQVISPRAIHHASWLGRMLPLRITAVGAALLGQTEELGYVVRRNSVEPDVTAVAAPVRRLGGDIVAAFSITGPSYRIADEDARRFGELVMKEAQSASSALGA
jgi:IclR family acetate operon transcriptional repressor